MDRKSYLVVEESFIEWELLYKNLRQSLFCWDVKPTC